MRARMKGGRWKSNGGDWKEEKGVRGAGQMGGAESPANPDEPGGVLAESWWGIKLA